MSRTLRIFIPTTVSGLRALADARELAGPLVVYFSDLPTSEFGPDEIEQGEFDALYDAAATSMQLLVESTDPPVRVVLAARAEANTPVLHEDGESVVSGLSIAAIDSIHIDEDSAKGDVDALLQAVRAGDEPTEAQYAAVEGRSLLWHDRVELRTIVEELSKP